MPRSLTPYSPHWDLTTIPDDVFATEWRRRRAAFASAARQTLAGGRPRSSKPRCPCERMTLARAEARGRSYEHDPSCTFYPTEPRALVV